MILLALACTSEPELSVLAASSLSEVMLELEQVYETETDLPVQLSLAGSQTLATQVRQGLRADYFASANTQHLDSLAEQGLLAKPSTFARGRLVLALPRASIINDLSQLPEVERLVIGTPEVPAGAYADQALEAAEELYGREWRAEVDKRVVSREPSVRLVRAKLLLGEADAALLYATDLNDHSYLRMIELPPEVQPAVHYGFALSNPITPAGLSWAAFVTSDTGREVLERHGFERP